MVIGLAPCPGRAAAELDGKFVVRSWHMEDGLPDDSVKTIVQTHDGYLWVGTDNGLTRFDSVHFETYNSGNTPALKSSRILSLLEDRRGRLWIGTAQGGLACFSHGAFQRVNLGTASESTIAGLWEDEHGTIGCVAAEGYVLRIRSDGLVMGVPGDRTELPLPDGGAYFHPTASSWFRPMTTDARGQVWLSSGRDLYTLQGNSWQKGMAGPGIIVLCGRRQGGLWLAGNGHFSEWEPGKAPKSLGPYPWGQGQGTPVTVLCEDHTGILWAGTINNGVLRRSEAGNWDHVVAQGPLAQNVISCIVPDREGSIWVGTENDGLYRLTPSLVQVVHLPTEVRNAVVVSACASKNGCVWLATGGAGLYQYGTNGQFVHIGAADGLDSADIEVLLEDRQTNLWVGTRTGLYGCTAGNFHKCLDGWVKALFEDRSGRLWVGTHGGVLCTNGQSANWYRAAEGLAHPDVRAITEDSQGRIWIGTVGGGLNCIEGGKMRHYGKAEGMSSQMVVALEASPDGALWIGTYDAGLLRLKGGRFRSFTTQDGLSHNFVAHILGDGEGNLWLGSMRGLMRIKQQALDAYQPGISPLLPCLTLSLTEGMFSPMCTGGTQPGMTWAADGCLWVPNMKSVVVVDPRKFSPEKPPAAVIEDLVVDGLVLPASGFGGPVRLPLGRSRIEFHYTALDVISPESTRFRYKLEGWDGDWGDAGVRRQAIYSSLPAGQYRFHVTASGRDGLWQEATVPVTLQIIPRFWQTSWFRLGIMVAVLAAVATAGNILARRKARQKIEQVERTQALERERARIAQDMHDELGAGLAQIALLADVGGAEPGNWNEASRSFTGIAQRARATQVALDEIIWAVNPRNDNLLRLADYLCRQAEECFDRSSIRCGLEIPTDLPPVPLHAELRHNLTLAFKEALTNTLKHSHASEVRIRLEWAPPGLAIEVEDNGCGFDPAAVSDTGNGLGNQKARLAKIGGIVEVRTQPGRGTRTVFRVSLKGQIL